MVRKKLYGTLMLLLAALIWGMAFVAQSAASQSVESFTFNASRSFVGAGFLGILLLARRVREKKSSVWDASRQARDTAYSVKAGLLCGLILFAAINLQQFGIASYPAGVAASGRSGFLTASYVVMVSLYACFSGRRVHPLVFFSALGCLAGLYMLCLSGGLSGVYIGDLLGLICAVFFTVHVLTIDRFSRADGVIVSCLQFVVCGVLSLICALLFESTPMDAILRAWLPVLYTGVMSSGVAYTLQILGQKRVEPAVASIVMSLESVFAALAGWVLLHEMLSGRELLGCALVFAAVLLAQTPALPLKKKDSAQT